MQLALRCAKYEYPLASIHYRTEGCGITSQSHIRKWLQITVSSLDLQLSNQPNGVIQSI